MLSQNACLTARIHGDSIETCNKVTSDTVVWYHICQY